MRRVDEDAGQIAAAPAADRRSDIDRLVERCFRERWRDFILTLTRKFGTGRLEEIENALQTAMLRALDRWPAQGVPENPAAWIVRVAQNLLIDGVRRSVTAGHKEDDVRSALYDPGSESPVSLEPLEDEALKMMMVCAHPALGQRDTIVITLRLICGLGASEIARGLLASETAIKKQLTRSKQKIRDLGLDLELPEPGQRDQRLERILQCIYLLFNEGYAAYAGQNLVRRDLCAEAERLIELVLRSNLADKGRVWALAALLSLQASRHKARSDGDGRLIRLSDQDRGLWDRAKIDRGFAFLTRSMTSPTRSRYHLEAAIAACHAAAPSYAETDWTQIREFYDQLIALAPSPVIELNRSVAVLMTEGPDAAIAILAAIDRAGSLKDMYLLPALLGDFHHRAGRTERAKVFYERALSLTHSAPIQRFLIGQTEACMLD